jgi:hypothetical protein
MRHVHIREDVGFVHGADLPPPVEPRRALGFTA